MKKKLSLQWSGPFIELCMGRLTPTQQEALRACCLDTDTNIETSWYANTDLLKTHFNAPNWWSVDDLDHAMGLVFADRADLEFRLTAMAFAIDGIPVTVDPEAIQLSFYAPEGIEAGVPKETILCHGARRPAVLRLSTEFEPPFDPTLITLSLLDYPDYGLVLIDLDYDGHDEIEFTFGDTTYLKPRCLGKESANDASR